MHQHPGAPGPAHRVGQPTVGGPAALGDSEAARDDLLVRTGAGFGGGLLGLQGEVEDLLLLATEHGQHPVRGQLCERLGEVEVVGELRARLLLALAHLRRHPAALPHALAQLADQVRVLAEPLGEDGPRAVEGGRRVGHAPVGGHERLGGGARLHRGVGEQPVGQRFEPGLPGDLRLGAPLGLEREIDVLKPRLGVGGQDARLHLRVELALRADRLQDRRPPLLQLTQPLLEGAQLRVVEHLGRFLAVARDERHGRTAVQQLDGGLHLPLPHPKLFGDPAFDGRRHFTLRFRLCTATYIVAGGYDSATTTDREPRRRARVGRRPAPSRRQPAGHSAGRPAHRSADPAGRQAGRRAPAHRSRPARGRAAAVRRVECGTSRAGSGRHPPTCAHTPRRRGPPRDAPPKSRASARKGSVTTVAMAPPMLRRTSAMARNTESSLSVPTMRPPGRPVARDPE